MSSEPPSEHELANPTTPQSSHSNGNGSNAGGSTGPGGLTGAAAQQHPSFRRQRAARACETCHARKVRCDAASLGVPCTNCVAFNIECKIPQPKRKKAGARKEDEDGSVQDKSPTSASPFGGYNFSQSTNPMNATAVHESSPPTASHLDAQSAAMDSHKNTFVQFMKPKFARAPIKEAGRVAYLGESSNLSLLVHDRHGTTDVVHYPLPENIRGSRARLTDLDNEEIDILHRRGAFLLPPRQLCDELVDAFFTHIAPVVPVINRSRFMRRYRDPKNPPSLLLLQTVLLAGSRVCKNPALMDSQGSTTPAAMTFYKRAKALYDANYEDDRVTIVQSLVLMGWYWEGPEDVTKNVFYWSRVATIVAQGSGMHRSVERSQLSRADKRLWKRIWWTLFTRDRMVAVALGRPVHINTDDSDVEMISEDDFIEDEDENQRADFPQDRLHVQFFLHHVKLCEIMGLVLSQQYSVASKARRQNAIDLTHSDMALADWMMNVPPEMRYHVQDRSRQNFWAALLHSTYYTTLCLLHRAHMPASSFTPNGLFNPGQEDMASYPSRNIAFTSATMITRIVENLAHHDQLRYCPAFIVYSLFSALIMHVYQMRSSIPSVVSTTQDRMRICMEALKEVSKVWLVAKMVYTLFESILGNKHLEDKLNRFSGSHKKGHKHKVPLPSSTLGPNVTDPMKRKFDDMDLGSLPTGPVQNVSYERSRPQTPAATPSMQHRELSGGPMGAPNTATSPGMMRNNSGADTFMGGTGSSRSTTRPPTPFQPSLSVPATPPDLYLVTRSSPPISQSIWENFQPQQLFPEDSGVSQFSPAALAAAVDPNLAQQGIPQAYAPQNAMGSRARPPQTPPLNLGTQGWPPQFDMDMSGSSPEDTWSNSSKGGNVPTTLNVEDWFNFFGLNGDLGPSPQIGMPQTPHQNQVGL